MAIPPIHSALQQMHTLAAQAAAKNDVAVVPHGTAEVGRSGFIDELQSSIEKINQLQGAASSSMKAFEVGDPNVSLSEVMVDKQKAGLAFEMGVQVRNRLIQSYKEIMNMQV
ncbi:flagellar hook-basal body complex protein FliE [Porticoccus sp.]